MNERKVSRGILKTKKNPPPPHLKLVIHPKHTLKISGRVREMPTTPCSWLKQNGHSDDEEKPHKMLSNNEGHRR